MKPLCARGEKTAGMIVKEQQRAALAAEANKPKPVDVKDMRIRDLLRMRAPTPVVKPDESTERISKMLASVKK